MNTNQLMKSCQGIAKFGGVYPKDVFLSSKHQKKMYIVNTDPSDRPGEHWFVVDNTVIPTTIFDSYGTQESYLTRLVLE